MMKAMKAKAIISVLLAVVLLSLPVGTYAMTSL
jgi:hypothetical protein